MIRRIQRKGTQRTGSAILFQHASANQVAKWCQGEISMEYPDDQPDTERVLAVVYKRGGAEKKVFLNEYLVEFQGEMYAVTYKDFQERFEFLSGVNY